MCQVECGTPLTNDKQTPVPYCGILSSYRSDNPAIITKYIRVNIHIMQKSVGDPQNFEASNPAHMAYLYNSIPDCNVRMQNLDEPYYGGQTLDPYIINSKIQFVLKDIYFHQDDYGYVTGKHICDSYWFDTYKVNEDSELNIFITNSSLIYGGGGCGQGYSGESTNYVNTNSWYTDYVQNPPNGSNWIKNPHLLHEIGHCLNLHHSWLSGQFVLFPDIYSPQTISSTWCDPATDYQCVNNIMSYSKAKTFLSPMQLEFLHKELKFSWRKKLVANCEEVDNYPIVVTQNQNWDYALSIAEALMISNAATVDVSCKFDMVETSLITINQLSTLNFNSADITTCKNCSKITFDVSGNLNFNNTPFIMSPNSTLNITSSGVVNINDVNGLCINQGGQINIAAGGQLFINGQDYTSILTNGYNNVYDIFFSNQPISGTHYAFNKIETSGLVTTLPNVPTDLIAGRIISFKPGFVGYSGLHASIDKNINNCEETPCGTGLRVGNFPNENGKVNQGTKLKNKNLVLISVFPNPNDGEFSLNISASNKNAVKDKEQFNIVIINSIGTKVFEKQVNTLSNNINVAQLPKGIYYVSVISNGIDRVGEAIIIR